MDGYIILYSDLSVVYTWAFPRAQTAAWTVWNWGLSLTERQAIQQLQAQSQNQWPKLKFVRVSIYFFTFLKLVLNILTFIHCWWIRGSFWREMYALIGKAYGHSNKLHIDNLGVCSAIVIPQTILEAGVVQFLTKSLGFAELVHCCLLHILAIFSRKNFFFSAFQVEHMLSKSEIVCFTSSVAQTWKVRDVLSSSEIMEVNACVVSCL